jgi:hypothetical protein
MRHLPSARAFLLISVLLSPSSAHAADMLVCNEQGTTISQYSSTGVELNPSFITGLHGPTNIAFDSSGDIFVVNAFNATIGEYTSTGKVINFDLINTPFHGWGICMDGNGHLFVCGDNTGSASGDIAEYPISGQPINTTLVSTGLAFPLGMTCDGNGHLFVAEADSGRIGEYTTTGSPVDAALISGLDYPVDLALDGNGNIFVADQILGVREYTTGGTLEQSQLAPGLNAPASITLDGSGNLFVGGPEASFTVPIAEYTTSGVLENASFISGLEDPSGIKFQPVPEPSSLSILALGAVALLRCQRQSASAGRCNAERPGNAKFQREGQSNRP